MTTDTWQAMALILAGESPPRLPNIPGRVHRAPPIPEADPFADEWDRRSPTTSTHQRTTDEQA